MKKTHKASYFIKMMTDSNIAEQLFTRNPKYLDIPVRILNIYISNDFMIVELLDLNEDENN